MALMPPENRDAEGRFLLGTSGNPGGRPRKLVELKEAIDAARDPKKVVDVLDCLYDLAMAGDVSAAKTYFDRVIGPVREEQLAAADLAGAPDEVVKWLTENGA